LRQAKQVIRRAMNLRYADAPIPLRCYDGAYVLAGDAVSENRCDRETQVRKARRVE
jgi:hypothetical protein